MKKRIILTFLFVVTLALAIFLGIFAYDFYRTKNSIRVSSQPITDPLTVASVNMPSYGFVQVVQLQSDGNILSNIGASSFLDKGRHQNVKVNLFNKSDEKNIEENQTIEVRLVADTTGERVFDAEYDKLMRSIFGFLYQAKFLSQ